jgi:hypothetical protein
MQAEWGKLFLQGFSYIQNENKFINILKWGRNVTIGPTRFDCDWKGIELGGEKT